MEVTNINEFDVLSTLVEDIAVIVLTYNQQNILSECLDSILSQKIPGKVFRIFVIDDASVDQTPAVILSYEAKYPGIIIPVLYKINQYQKGGTPEFPVVFNLSTEYLAFCDGDDYWTDSLKLAKQIDILESDVSLALVHTDYFLGVSSGTQKILERRDKNSQEKARSVKNSIDMIYGNEIKKSTALFRYSSIDRVFLEKCHGIRAQDWLVAISATLNGGVSYIDEPTTFYRVSENASFQSLDQNQRNLVKDEVRWTCAANLPDGELKNQFRQYLVHGYLRMKLRESLISLDGGP